MSIEQGFHLNISRVIPKNIGKAFGPYYQGYCSIFLGDHLEAHILPVAQDIVSRFPEPEFKHELMKWESRGYSQAVPTGPWPMEIERTARATYWQSESGVYFATSPTTVSPPDQQGGYTNLNALKKLKGDKI